ncbi:beta-D-glucosyl crocetin beta-1,6-glucosyltransferase-like [Salvia hispanica]|uniref:beta-D-glucosyl crocetin beta-1,6-glucosyltransferase-like n=1 Tax=Salvia hispanica TaxID=49212 RepID=UPI0020095561|nr:beta-D-glucosyl crocetin beta-1,6-glucosyltransferase-like [Salvia hispanica]
MDSPSNILMFPWLAHGHISPYLELAKRLSRRNFVVHLCSTAANFKSIEKDHQHSIRRVVLHLPETLLPRRLHTTNGLPPEHMEALKETLDLAAPELRRVLSELRPDLLVYDFLQPWAPQVAAEHGVPAVEFITSSATMNAYLFHFFSPAAAEDDFPFPEVYYREYELVHRDRLLAVDEGVRRNAFAGVRRSNGAVLIKGFSEIEAKYSDYLAELLGKKVVPVGALVQEATTSINGSNELINWLDKKEKNSTVFVSFGSEYFLSKEDILELAHGLELSNFNFIWVIRFPKREDGNKIVLEDSLPLGFLERVEGRGLVVEGWAPQAQILGHESVGGFVSHCGCSSMMESMKFGVPIIAMPMHIDQPLNARLVELIGVGVEVVRDGRGRLEKEVVAEVIRRVVGDEGIRKSAVSMREKLRLKGDEEIDDVVAVFVKLIWENKVMKKRNKKSKWLAFTEILYSIF